MVDLLRGGDGRILAGVLVPVFLRAWGCGVMGEGHWIDASVAIPAGGFEVLALDKYGDYKIMRKDFPDWADIDFWMVLPEKPEAE